LYEEFYKYNAQLQPEHYKEVSESGDYPRSVIEGADSDIFVAAQSQEIVGFIHIYEDKTPPYPPLVQHRFAGIMDLYVTSSFRRKGIGTQLIASAKEWAMARGLEYIELMVLNENVSGMNFYIQSKFTTALQTMRYRL
jgi:ribosomal protein S18 acetylase RimI-like enzyme